MADPVTLAVVATAATATTQVAGGLMEQRAARGEAAQYGEEARTAELAGQQEEVQRRRQLEEALGAAATLRAARGLDSGSGTGRAIAGRIEQDARSDINTGRVNRASQANRLRLGGAVAKARGQAAVIRGIGDAAGTLTGHLRQRAEIGAASG